MFPRLKRIKRAAGTPLFFSFSSDHVTPDELLFLRETQPSGAIFFKRNISSIKSLKDFTKTLTKEDYIALLGIDEEGGRVRRLPDGPYSLPSARDLSLMKKSDFTRSVQACAQTLASCGINMNFAPVVDIRSGEDDTIIGDRAFSNNVEEIIKNAELYLSIMQKEQVFGVIKHFPGHGTTTVDSHKSLPEILKSFDELNSEDLIPYKELTKSHFVMVAHLLMKEISPLPSSLSPEWADILHKKTGFKGISMTDDIEMHALDVYSVEKRSTLFLESGYDMMMICSGKQDVMHAAWETILRNIENSKELLARLELLQKRIENALFSLKSMK